jgi:hypothetical protein
MLHRVDGSIATDVTTNHIAFNFGVNQSNKKLFDCLLLKVKVFRSSERSLFSLQRDVDMNLSNATLKTKNLTLMSEPFSLTKKENNKGRNKTTNKQKSS